MRRVSDSASNFGQETFQRWSNSSDCDFIETVVKSHGNVTFNIIPRYSFSRGQVGETLRVLMNLIAEYKGSAANALFNYQALDADDEEDDEDYDG